MTGSGSVPAGTSGGAVLPPIGSADSSYSTAPMGSAATQRSNAGPAEVERELVSAGDTVYFAFDSYSLDDRAQQTLNRQATLVLRNNQVSLTIEGHADERGTREYNLALGERRATAVKDYLVAFGISPSRIRTISYGEERPAVLGSNEEAWARNRRAVTVVTGSGAGS